MPKTVFFPRQSLLTGCILGALAIPGAALATPAMDSAANAALMAGGVDLSATRDERMGWFRDAKFGMFIHWGVYAMWEGQYQGNDTPRYAEWIWNNGRIPADEYIEMGNQFNPVNYDPKAWAEMAEQAGMTYMVITAKHHDGWALWDTPTSDWGVKDTPWGKDLLGPLKDAATDAGLRFGFYYSQSLDWGNQGDEGGVHWDKSYTEYGPDKSTWPERLEQYHAEIARPQVEELTTRYGDLDIFWWDMPKSITDDQGQQLADILWGNQPHIVSNGRLTGRNNAIDFGDFDTHEQSIPAVPQLDSYWESCMTMNHTWGWRVSDHDWKSTTTLIHNLTGVVAKGGNYLLNIGPKPDGSFPQASIDRLHEIGLWMDVNGEAIHGTEATPFLFQQAFNGAVTQRKHDEGTTLYLHVYDWPSDGELRVLGVGNDKLSAYLLADDKRSALTVNRDDKGVTIAVGGDAPDPHSSTVVLEVKGELDIFEVGGVMTAEGMILRALDSQYDGAVYESWDNSLSNWTADQGPATWSVDFNEPGRYAIEMLHGNLEDAQMALSLGEYQTELFLPATADLRMGRKHRTPVIVGELEVLKGGEQTLSLIPTEDSGELHFSELTVKHLPDALQRPDGNITLNALSADYAGQSEVRRGARHLLEGQKETFNWMSTITRQAGHFDAVIRYQSEQAQQLAIYVGEQRYDFTLPATGAFVEPLDIHLGQLNLSESGATPIRMEVTAKDTMDFYGIELYEANFFAAAQAEGQQLSTQFPIARAAYSHVDNGQHPQAYFADKVLDGNSETRWRPNIKKVKQRWFEIDQGEAVNIKTITTEITAPKRNAKLLEQLTLTVRYQDAKGQWQTLATLPVLKANEGFSVDKAARLWRFEFSEQRGNFSVRRVEMTQ
ncbi:alpha-L-fucosidase [Ferrimonas pelagia]|uniref:alpha-L-fucosidase n=1 Tax=Ferrimonas pelagia TaxID=1177826 RepID=UPI0031EB0CAF